MAEPITRLHIDGKEIILIGTAHVSKVSADLVRETILAEKPDSVCIELDPKRYESIQNPKAWEETDLVKVIKNKRVGFMLANLFLGAYQKRVATNLGVQAGSEMLEGIKCAKEIDATIVLADRDIQTTFLRIWRKLTMWDKCKLLTAFLFGEDDEDISEEDLRQMMEEDMLSAALAELKGSFPQIGEILISERDQFLAQKIKKAKGEKVVAVLGGAHIPGVVRAMDTEVDMAKISHVPPAKKTGKIIAWAIPIAILALMVYAFVTNFETGMAQLSTWVLWNSGLAALGALIVLAHPLAILSAFVVAPISSMNPFLAAGWVAGLVQATVQKPKVSDLQSIHEDIGSIKGLYKNRALKVLFVVVFANIGSSVGTFLAGATIIQNLFG